MRTVIMPARLHSGGARVLVMWKAESSGATEKKIRDAVAAL
jgi:hypothetical protein